MTEEEKSRERLLTHKNGIIIEDSTTHEVAQYRKTEVPSEARQGQLLAREGGEGVVVAVADAGAVGVATQEDRGTATVSAFSMIRRTIGVILPTIAIITTITAITTDVILSCHTALACPVITRLAT